MPKIIDVFEKNKYNIAETAKQSKTWFDREVVQLKKEIRNPKSVFDGGLKTMRPRPDNLYMFFYDAKHKATLPYWDMFPLIFPYADQKGGFMGLNLHYIPYRFRIYVMDELLKIAKTTMSDRIKMDLSWGLIQKASKLRYLQPCVKRYLLPHVMSPFKLIKREDWGTAALLPLSQFQGASEKQIWKISREQGKF